MIAQFIQDNWSEVLLVILTAFFGSGWWKSRQSWLKTFVAVLAKGAVAQAEVDYVIPTKEESGDNKLTPIQQKTAQTMAGVTIKDALVDAGVAALSATGPIIRAAVDKAVEDAKKTLPQETQKLFPTQ